MNIHLNRGVADPYFVAAENIVGRFCEQQPCGVEEEERRKLIESIATKIFKIDITLKKSKLDSAQIYLAKDSFPQLMKSWISITQSTPADQTSQIDFDHCHQADDECVKVSSSNLPDYSFLNQDWKDVAFVRMAKEGQRGAWFFVNPLRGSVVIKNQIDPEKQVMGTLFLRGMGMDAPDCKLVDSQSDEGKQIEAAGQTAQINRANPRYYIVIDRVKGSSYSDLSTTQENIDLIKKNLKKFGELAVYDLVLGNFDRFQLDSTGFNGGNMMFENKHLRPIDTDCSFEDTEGRKSFSQLALKKIINGKTDLNHKIAFKLEQNLGAGLDHEVFSVDEIKDGMNEGIAKLIRFSENIEVNRELFINGCRERGVYLTSFPSYVADLLSYIQSNYNNFENARG